MKKLLTGLLILVVLGTGASRADLRAADPVRIFAAISTREALARAAEAFSAETGIPIEMNAGATSDLARQIVNGARADLLLSADEEWADFVAARQRVPRRQDLLTNRLVVVVPESLEMAISSIQDLAKSEVRRIAVAAATVPAGRYARQACNSAGIWEAVRDRLIEGGDVRAALAYVTRGEAEAGIVYATDVGPGRSVKVACVVPEGLHGPIRYPLLLLESPGNEGPAQQCFDFLCSEKARPYFLAAGFSATEPETGGSGSKETATWAGLAAEDWRAVGLSLKVAGLAVLLSLPVGIAVAWVLARKQFPGKILVETAVNLPLVLPPVVTGYLLLLTLGRRGWIGSWLERWWGLEIALTWRAAVLAVAVMGFPLLVRAIRLSFHGLDPRLFQAARSLGAGPLDAFLTISLPLARRGVIAGVVLAFARGLGEFGATLVFAGNQETTRTLALQVFALQNVPDGASEHRMWALVVASVVLAALALAGSEILERRGLSRDTA